MDLCKDPIKIVYVDRNLKPLSVSLFVGLCASDIITEIQTISKRLNNNQPIESKKLKTFYGADWKQKLGFDMNVLKTGGHIESDILKTGGDVENGRNNIISTSRKAFLNAEDDIIDIRDMPGFSPTKPLPEKQKQDQISFETKQQIHEVITDIGVFPEDRIMDLKLKIYATSGTTIYNQHIFVTSNDQVIPMRYKITADGIVPVNIVDALRSDDTLFGFPVDHNIYPNKDSLKIISFDYNETVGNVFKKLGVNTFYVVDLNILLQPKLGSLREQFKQDKIQLELFYYSFIIKFWPIISLSVFELILENCKIRSGYPDLEPSRDSLYKRLKKETILLNRKYEVLQDAFSGGFKKFPKFAKFSPNIDTVDINSLIEISIKSAVLEVNSGAETSTLVGKTQIDAQQLYRNMETSHQIPIIKTNLIIQNKPIIMTKYDRSVDDIQQAYQTVKYRMQLPYFNSILFALRISSANAKIGGSDFLVVVVRNNGKYMVRSNWEKSLNFKMMFSIIKETINPHIENINKLGRSVFTSASRLRPITNTNSKFSDLNMTMLWKQSMTDTGFKNFGEFLRDDFESDIIRSKTGMLDADDIHPNMIEFSLFKGMTDIDPLELEKSVVISNYYNYLTDPKIKQKWDQIISGKPITITRRTTDIRFDLSDLREEEFRYFYSYFIVRMFDSCSVIKQKGTAPTSKRTTQNRLKYLKEKDPELFKFKRFGSDIVYSRICQKAYQPEIYTEGEFDSLPQTLRDVAVKYWNFTTKTPAYYVCPNPKFPSLSFIHDKHPKKYCLPCCKKSPTYEFKIVRKKTGPGKTNLSKKETIYQSCLLNHEYTGDTDISNNRYIMKYGKPLDIGRISAVPSLLDKYFRYNISDAPQTGRGGYITNDYGFGLKTYNVEELWKISKNNKTRKVSIDDLRDQLETPKWSYKADGEPDYTPMDIIKNPNLSSSHTNRITNADMTYPILVYRNIQNNSQKMVDGLHRLAKALTQEHKTIDVKYITRRQLAKAEVSAEPVKKKSQKIDTLKKPGFYLYGVPQNTENITDVGGVFSIAAGMGISIKELAQKCISHIKKSTNGIMYFKTLLGGRLSKYFTNIEDLISTITTLFIDSKSLGISDFKLWNELFIDIVKYCFNFHVLIFDDRSVDISGTSIKHTDYVQDIRIVLPEKVVSADDIIPESTEERPITREYLLLLRKRKRSKSIFSHNFLYYPMFIFTPHEFFKTLEIDQKIFSQDDEIIKLISNILDDTLGKSNNTFEITISVIWKFLESIGGSIVKIYVTSSNLCYAVDLEFGKTRLTIPVRYSTRGSIWADVKIQREPISIKVNQTYDMVVSFMRQYNKFIVEKSKKLGMINIGEDTEEKSVTPIHPFMKVDKIITHKNKIIGVSAHGLYYYFKPIASDQMKTTIRKMSSPYNVFAKFPVDIVDFKHSPDLVNNHIWEHFKNKKASVKDTRFKLLPEAYYDRYLYQMFVMSILQYLDTEKNTQIRNRIKKLINITKFRNIESLDVFRTELKTELTDFPQDIELIRGLVNEYYMEHFDRIILIDQFESGVYQFDRISFNEIEKISKDFGVNDDPKIRINVRDKLKKIASHVVVIVSHSQVLKNLDSDSRPGFICGSKVLGCVKEKLSITQVDFDNLLDIITDDFLNPLKREYLLSSIYTPHLLNEFKFTKKENEQIYIKTF